MPAPFPPDDRLQPSFEFVPGHLRPVVVALLGGATDLAACNQLHLSPRTYSRRLAELLMHFEAQTRFQAGVRFGMSARPTGLRDDDGPTGLPGG